MNPNNDMLRRVQAAKAAGFTDQQIAQRLQMRPPQAPQMAQPAPQSSGLLDLLPLIGGVGGGILGAPFGPVGSIGGSGVGSALGEYLRQKASGSETDIGGIAKEGVLGLAGGTLGEALGFGVRAAGKLLPRAARGLTKAGTEVIGSQYNVPRQTARALKLPETVQRLATEFGITNIDEIPKIAEKVTGESGVLSKLTREAAGQAGNVNTTGLLQMTQDLIGNPAIEAGTEKKVLSFIKKGLQKIHGGSKGSLLEGADPSETFGFIQQLEKEASKINRIPQFQRTGQDMALKEVYQNLADELKDRLFIQAGGDKALVSNIIKPELLAQIAEINPQLAQKVANVKSVGELRSLAEPFVKGSQLAAETELGSNLGFQKIGPKMKGAAEFLPSLSDPLAPLRPLLGSNAVSSKIGSALIQTGERVGRAGLPSPVGGILPRAAGRTATQSIPRAAADIFSSGGMPQGGNLPAEEGTLMPDEGVSQDAGGLGLTKQEALALMLAYPKQASTIKAIFEFGAPEGGEKVSAQQTKDRSVAQSGLRQLDTIEQILASDPSVIFKASIPGSPGARKYLSAVREAADAILRLRTGAQANKTEIELYMQQFFPQPFDSPETIRYKILTRRQYLQDIAKGQGANAASIPLPENATLN